MQKYLKHRSLSEKAHKEPYKQPIVPLTRAEAEELQASYGVSWHVLQKDVDLDVLLTANLNLTDLKVFNCIVNHIVYKSYSSASTIQISELLDIGPRSVQKCVKRLKEINLVLSLSDEILDVHPTCGWIGDSWIREEAIRQRIAKVCYRGVDFLVSKEYARLVRQWYRRNDGQL